ncbi:tyrosine-type recombinase/integrase [Kitasatospora sp. NPDC091207]|uniref:tyrosine-type recombinase/integrase n=1 Tax=Kitasatospora sp. NPDC091207 TaxID=3364083 RepID=UPI0037F75A8B
MELPSAGATPRGQNPATFLQHGAEQYADQLTDLFEVMLGTGMRRGEVLALHWSDIHLMDRKLYVRWTLAAIDNGKIHLREAKTEAGRAWVSLSPRVMAALHRQAAIQMAGDPEGLPEGLVLAHADGSPLRPRWVLNRLTQQLVGTLSQPAGMPLVAYRDGEVFVLRLDPPGIDPKTIDLDVERNVLSMRVPVSEKARPRKITITAKAERDAISA